NQFDLVNRLWNDAIVQFNALRQQSLLTPFGIDKADYADLVAALVALTSLVLGVFAWWVLRSPRTGADGLDAAYARLCGKLARAGAERGASEGPHTLTLRVTARWPENRDLHALLARYVSLRYACAFPPIEAVRDFARSVASLRVRVPARPSRA